MKTGRHPRWRVLGFWLVGCALAGLAGAWQAAGNRAAMRSEFSLLAERAVRQVSARMGAVEFGLRSAEDGMLAGGEQGMSRVRFQRFCDARNAHRAFPGEIAFGLVKRVSRENEAAFLVSARRERPGGFDIHPIQVHDGERYIVQYVDAEKRYPALLGLDLASEPTLRRAAELAMSSDAPTLSGPMSAPATAIGGARSMFMLLPVYRPDAAKATADARRSATAGWVFSLLRAEEVFRGIDNRRGAFSLKLMDVNERGAPQVIYATPNADDAPVAGLASRLRLPVYGRTWDLEIKAKAPFVEQLAFRDARAVAAIGVLATTLAAGLLHLYLVQVRAARPELVDQTEAVWDIEPLQVLARRKTAPQPPPVAAPPVKAPAPAAPPKPPPRAPRGVESRSVGAPVAPPEENGANEQAALRLPGVRVLAVDDSSTNLDVVRRIATSEGAEITTATNGEEAVVCLRANPDAFDIVLMDVHMPVLDGNDAARRIRDELGLRALPIVAMTAGALASERQESLDAGMNDFIIKPFHPQQMIRAIRKQVEQARGAPLPLVFRSAALDVSPGGWPTIDGIDGRDAAMRLSGDFELFVRMLGRLVQEFRDLANPLAPPETSAAAAVMAARVHKLRGAAGMLGAVPLQKAAEEVENMLRGGEADPAGRLFGNLAAQVQRMLRASAPVLAEAGKTSPPPADSVAAPPDPAALNQLLAHIRQQSLAALECFKSLEPSLRAAMDEGAFVALRDAVENLQFQEAAKLLETGFADQIEIS